MGGLRTAEKLQTPEQLMERWQCSKAAIYRWVESGALRPVRIGRLLRFTTEEIERFERDGAG
jgi:excisionase family DNA binding protein